MIKTMNKDPQLCLGHALAGIHRALSTRCDKRLWFPPGGGSPADRLWRNYPHCSSSSWNYTEIQIQAMPWKFREKNGIPGGPGQRTLLGADDGSLLFPAAPGCCSLGFAGLLWGLQGFFGVFRCYLGVCRVSLGFSVVLWDLQGFFGVCRGSLAVVPLDQSQCPSLLP